MYGDSGRVCRIIKDALRTRFPGVPVGSSPHSRRGRAVALKVRRPDGDKARRWRVYLGFIAPSLAEARETSLAAAEAIAAALAVQTSDCEKAFAAVQMRKISSCYVVKSALYRLNAALDLAICDHERMVDD